VSRPPLTPGVYRVAAAAEAFEGLARTGWDARLVPPVDSTAALYGALAGALALPSWFGANLDALWDCLSDLTRPTALVLDGWGRFEQVQPGPARRFVDLFAERTAVDPPFVVALA